MTSSSKSLCFLIYYLSLTISLLSSTDTMHRLILIAEKTTVYTKFPTPLINRLEKHFVLTSSVLDEWQLQVLHDLEIWMTHFSHVATSDAMRR